ncbi:MAG: hypoxanthine phosphoribosyltransferase [Deltaproteobacteria bacterium]|nr:hypoxanthine phosphoribosyltransferase [Deltaproteobacteria bacterium]
MKTGSVHSFHGRDVEVLFSRDDITSRLQALAKDIEKDYHGKELVVVGVLKGSFLFMADLVRCISLPLTCDFLRVSSYEGEHSTGDVRMEFDMTQPIHGKDVLLVEDIVDTGNTLRHLLSHLKAKQPSSLRVASLLFKETGRNGRSLVDYIAFEVPNRFVVGYGLDYEGQFRSLPFVGAFI